MNCRLCSLLWISISKVSKYTSRSLLFRSVLIFVFEFSSTLMWKKFVLITLFLSSILTNISFI